jgi:hypothetical protein
MTYDIHTLEDANFKIETHSFGEQYIASDGERVVIGPTKEIAVEGVKELQEPNKSIVNRKRPLPTPLENPTSSGMSWFSGTSWDTAQ